MPEEVIVKGRSGNEALIVVILRPVRFIAQDPFTFFEVVGSSEYKENDLPIEKEKLST